MTALDCGCIGPLYPSAGHECPQAADPVTAAAIAWHDARQVGLQGQSLREDGKHYQWDDLTDTGKRAARALVEPVVRAAFEARERALAAMQPAGQDFGEAS